MRALTSGLSVVCVLVLSAGTRAAMPDAVPRLWSGDHAPTIPRGRVEIGLLQSTHYGVTDQVELSLHPLLFLALPHVELKALAFERGRLSLAARGRLAYPTLFLGLVAREGPLGLLPKTSSPPHALQIEGDLLASVRWGWQQVISASLGLAVAPHAAFTAQELPLLDFPFLYPRFAALHSVLVPRARVGFEGQLRGGLYYDVSLSGYLMPELPDVGTAFALEQALTLEYRFTDHVAVSAGLRVSEAEYPYATLVHFLPHLDARVGF